MKTPAFPACRRLAALFLASLMTAALLAPPVSRADEIALPATISATTTTILVSTTAVSTGRTVVENVAGGAASPEIVEIIYTVANGAVLTFVQNDSSTGQGLFSLNISSGNFKPEILKIAPDSPDGTGWTVFDGMNTSSNSIFNLAGRPANGRTTTVDITNATFSNNQSSSLGSTFQLGNNRAHAYLTNVLFKDNWSSDGPGLIRNAGGIFVMTGGTITGNYSLTQNGGVFDTNNAGTTVGGNGDSTINTTSFTNVLFEDNRAARNAGVGRATNNARYGTIDFINSIFTNNWAGITGGVIFNEFTDAAPFDSDYEGSFNIIMTDAGNYSFTGNGAGYSGANTAAADAVRDNIRPGSAQAKAGGFLYTTLIGLTTFDIQDDVTLNIGDAAATDKALDSIASETANARIKKTGGGDLILNADNAWWQGSFAIDEGRVFLGNAGARLGGMITVASGATFGGVGTLQTFDRLDAAQATSVTFQPGSTLQVGTDGATSAETLAFARTGANTLTLEGGVTLKFDLFGVPDTPPPAYDQLIADQLTATGVNTIELTGLGEGTYTLISAGAFTGDETNFTYTPTARNGGVLEKSGNDLLLHSTLNNLAIKWTGMGAANWNNINVLTPNWTDGHATSPENYFRTGDHVTFDSVTDAGAPANRAITVAAEGVTVSGMSVEGDGDYTFSGGSITVDAASAQAGFTGTTGKLAKSGTGTLLLQNAANDFGRVEIAGGTISFSDAAQLGAGANDISISGNATLQMTNTAEMTLTNKIAIAAGGTATLDTAGADVAYTGDLSGVSASATLVKTGTGALLLSADYSFLAPTMNTFVNAGSLRLTTATTKLGGNVTIAAGGALSGIGGVGGAVEMQAGSLLHVGTASATTGQTLSIGSLTLQGATLQFDLFEDMTGDLLDIGTLTSVAGSNTIDFGVLSPGQYIIATAASGDFTALAGATVTVGGMVPGGARQSVSLSAPSGTSLIATTIVDISRAMTWTGTGGSSMFWDATTDHWAGSGGFATFLSGDRVTFDDTSADSTHDIDIPGLRATVSDMIVNAASNYTFTGGPIIADANSVIALTGSDNLTGATGKLIKQGSGTLTLANTGTNNFTGGIELQGGALVLASFGAGGTTSITVDTAGAGARLAAGIDGLAIANDIALSAAADTLTLDTQGNTVSLAGAITGEGALAVAGGGVLTLSGSNSFAGDLALSGGTLAIAHASALGVADKTLAFDGAGAALQWQVDGLDITQAISAGASFALETLGNSGTISGNITGSGDITKTGTGTLTLDGDNTAFSGALVITEGAVIAHAPDALGAATNALDIAAGASLDLAMTSGAAVPGGTLAFAHALSGDGVFGVSLGQTTDEFVFDGNAASSFAGILRMDKGTLRLDDNAAAALAAPTSNLTIGAEAVAQKAGGAFTINSLTLDGGRLDVTITSGTPSPSELLTVTTLDTGTGITQIGVNPADFDPGHANLGNQDNPAVPPDANLFDQDNYNARTLLVAADAITGSGDVRLVASDGSELPATHASIVQAGMTDATSGTVATATYSYGASVQADGIYMGHGLVQLDIAAGKTLVLDNTGATDSTLDAVLAGDGGVDIFGVGVITLTRQNTYTGTTTINSGIVTAGAANILAESAALEIAGGAEFVLNNHTQAVQNLSGAGMVRLGSGTLAVQNTADTVFSGQLGAADGSRLIKTGNGKLTLLHNSNNQSVTELAAGTLGVGASGALGAASGALIISGTGTSLDVDVADIAITQRVDMGTNSLLINTNAGGVTTFSGVISGSSQLALEGSGTVVLSGNNSFNQGLVVNIPRVVTNGRVNGVGSGTVTLSATSTLEYRGNIITGTGNVAINYSIIGGGAVEVFNSGAGIGLMSFNRPNTLSRFHIGEGGRVLANHASALGGATSSVEISGSSWLVTAVAGIAAQNLTVREGSALVFNYLSLTLPSLQVSGSTLFENDTAIIINTTFTGERILIETPLIAGLDNIAFDPGPNNTGFLRYHDGKLRATLINMAANPGKDIAATYDAMATSMKAVHSRVSESLLLPLSEKNNGAWIKIIGSFADYQGDSAKIGYREDTYGMVVGYDDDIGPGGIWGAYVGYNNIDIRTSNNATNKGKLPHAGLYAGKRWENSFFAVADIMAGRLEADTHRFEQIGFNTGTYRANVYGATVEAGFVVKSWQTGSVRPSFSLHYLRADFNSQNETGASPFYVDDFTAHRLEAFSSVHVTQQFKTPWKRPGYLDFLVGWRTSHLNRQTRLTASFSRTSDERFEIDCDNYDRDGSVIGLGLRMMISESAMLGVNYDHEVSSDAERHNVNATLRWAW